MRRRTSRPKHKPQAASFEARITRHPILTFTPKPEVEFLFENRKLKGYADEPIAAALVANGVKVFRVTEKMHRPRSFFCAVGKCSSCLMEVDGRPNVMVCMEPLKAGMKVRRQTGRGELGQDSPQRHF
jgi:predicted molibdopterin-dependent oxidoreductase YjgC